MQTPRSPEVHDVVVIGSGAAGGMAAWNLTRKGMRVLIAEFGQAAVDAALDDMPEWPSVSLH